VSAAPPAASDRPALLPGERLGPYEIRGVLGSGGLGTVYRALDPRLGREVAVKVLAEGAAAGGSLVELEREARLLASLSHPNILGIFDLGEDHGRRYAVTELLAGVDLRQRMRGGRLPWRSATAIALEVAKGLAAAHARGVVHLDLKPENVFVLAEGGVKILDFGLARRERERPVTIEPDPERGDDRRLVVAGTPAYLAPEQLAGAPVDHRSDIFALGGMLHELLTGSAPFRRDSLPATMRAIADDEAPALAGAAAAVPGELAGIVRRCLRKDPEKRFQTSLDLAFALAAVLARPPAGNDPAPARPPWRVRAAWFAAGVAAALTALLLLALLPD
jgi:serine/threonine protein kinase